MKNLKKKNQTLKEVDLPRENTIVGANECLLLSIRQMDQLRGTRQDFCCKIKYH